MRSESLGPHAEQELSKTSIPIIHPTCQLSTIPDRYRFVDNSSQMASSSKYKDQCQVYFTKKPLGCILFQGFYIWWMRGIQILPFSVPHQYLSPILLRYKPMIKTSVKHFRFVLSAATLRLYHKITSTGLKCIPVICKTLFKNWSYGQRNTVRKM